MTQIKQEERLTAYPLSFAQQRLWFLHQLDPLSTSYNVFLALELTGKIDIYALESAFKTLIERHEILRTQFILDDNKPCQRVLPIEQIKFILPIEDFTSQCEKELEVAAYEEAQSSFDLEKAPLVRIKLLRAGLERHILCLCFHHIIIDGWSIHLLFEELSQLYSNNLDENIYPISKRLQYLDFSQWQHHWLDATPPLIEKQTAYWLNQLKNLPTLELATDYQRPLLPSYKGQRHSFKVNRELTTKLKQLAKEVPTTLFVTLLTGFLVVLSRYTAQDDITIGTPNASRHYPHVESMLGFFINLLMLRCKIPNNINTIALLKNNHQLLVDAFANQDVPFEKIVEMLHPSRETTTNPISSILFVFQNYAHEPLHLTGLQAKRLFADNESLLFA